MLGFFDYYTSAPLPFQGQKRNFAKKFAEVLGEFPDDAIYLDLFGGSGLLSHITKRVKPEARVIWNDYDDYYGRFLKFDQTNEILGRCNELLKLYRKDEKISHPHREEILKIISEYENPDFISLSSRLLFSGQYAHSFAELSKKTLFSSSNSVSLFTQAGDFFDGIERTSCDYSELYKKHKDENIVLVCDPPYLQTDRNGYVMSGKPWRMVEFLKLFEILKHPFFFFSSEKSDFKDYIEFCVERGMANEWIKNMKFCVTKAQNHGFSSYKDMMYWSARC
ncbi:MAG: DNA adenine methylase [Campylobacter gracilis]|uniref:DNA adenine methylase n=1 Tax=Campylobacter gracilis TaxID=824 RepID=UPI0026EC527A|nr:DNA adenine methylase [Campylobacter gracilis]MBS6151885.1 DNA adenine methylase [Campylobacter gracilis]